MLFFYFYSAEAVCVDGIYYSLIEKGGVATVISGEKKYSGNIDIPRTFVYDDVEYYVTKIGSNAFSNCTQLLSVKMDEGITEIGNSAFYGCTCLNSLILPNSITTIGESAFTDCKSLVSIHIPALLNKVGNEAFSSCEKLEKVYISDLSGWFKIQWNYQKTMRSMKNEAIDIDLRSNNPLSYAKHLYLDNIELTNLVIPIDITVINECAMFCCEGIESVKLHDGVTEIKDCAFYGCTNLKDVIFDNNLTNIGNYAFQNTAISKITWPLSISKIGLQAFYGCESITSVNLPNSVTSWGAAVFACCKNLKTCSLPTNMGTLPMSFFYGCINLENISVPDKVSHVGDYAFYASGIERVDIGKGFSTVGKLSFAYCTKLKDFYCYAIQVPTYARVASKAFEGSYTEFSTLYVLSQLSDDYNESTLWNGFGNIIAIDSDLPKTPKCATPTFNLVNGQIVFECETEGVNFVSEVTAEDAKKYYEASVTLSQKYKVTVYSTKAGYDDSDIVTREIIIKGDGKAIVTGDANLDGKVDAADVVTTTNIIMNKE